jgi:hypothetical protein
MCRPMNSNTLAMLVVEELEHRVSTDKEFTAYDITRAIRRRQPRLDIRHEAVRVLVHHYMNSLIAAGHYQADMRAFGVTTAVQYAPASMGSGSRPSIVGVPLLPLN